MFNPFTRKPAEIEPTFQKELHALVRRYLRPTNIPDLVAVLLMHAVATIQAEPRVPRDEQGPQLSLLLSEAMAIFDGRVELRKTPTPAPGSALDGTLLQHLQDMVRGPLEAEGFPMPMDCASAMLGVAIRILLANGRAPEHIVEHTRKLVAFMIASPTEQQRMLAEVQAKVQAEQAAAEAAQGSATKPS